MYGCLRSGLSKKTAPVLNWVLPDGNSSSSTPRFTTGQGPLEFAGQPPWSMLINRNRSPLGDMPAVGPGSSVSCGNDATNESGYG